MGKGPKKGVFLALLGKDPQRRVWAGVLFFLLAYSTLLCWHQLSRPREVSAPGADMAIHLPFKVYWVESLKQGDPAFWNPYVTFGIPFVGHPSVSVFSPFNVLHLTLPTLLAFKLETLFHFFLGGWGMLLLLRAWGCGWWAGLTGALAFSFQAFGFVHHFAGQISMGNAAAWLPWVLYSLERASQGKQWRWVAAAGAFGALSMFEGYPQISYYILLLADFYLLALLWRRRVTFGEVIQMGLGLSIAFVALSACLLFPASEFVAESNRSTWGYGNIMTDYEEWRKILFLLAPRFLGLPQDNSYNDMGHWSYHETAIYIGLLPVVLFMLAPLLRPKQGRLYLWCLGVGLLFWLLSMGRSTPYTEVLYKFFYEFVPGFGVHRSIGRMTLVTGFCLAAGGALVMDRLGAWLASQGARKGRMGWGALLAAFLLPAILAATAYDLWAYGKMFMGTRPNNYFNKNILFPEDFAAEVVADKTFPRIQPESQIHGNILFRVGELKGNDMTLPKDSLTYREMCSDNNYDNPLSDLARMRYMWCPKDISAGGRWRAFKKDHFINDKVLPRAFLAGAARAVPSPEEALLTLRQGLADPAGVLLLQTKTDPPAGEPGHLGAASIETYRNNEVVIRCDAPRPCYLFLSDCFFPGWHATLDGKSVPILKANGTFRAVRIDQAGPHLVRMVYRPLWLYLGLAVSIPAWLLLLACWRRWGVWTLREAHWLRVAGVWTLAVLGQGPRTVPGQGQELGRGKGKKL